MNKRYKAHLVSLGLEADATDEQARAFAAQLTGVRAAIAAVLDYPEGDTAAATSADLMIRAAGYNPESPDTLLDQQTTEDTDTDTDGQRNDVLTAADAERIATEAAARAVTADRARADQIRALAGDDIPAEVVNLSIAANESVGQASQRFLTFTRNRPGGVPGGAPAGHTADTGVDLRTLEAIALLRANRNPVDGHIRYDSATGQVRQAMTSERETIERAADNAQRYRAMSMVDMVRHGAAISGVRNAMTMPMSELFRVMKRSGSSFSAVEGAFTTSLYAMMLNGYETVTYTTAAFTHHEDVDNFLTNERNRLENAGSLKKHVRGGDAADIGFGDNVETYKVHRYSGKFSLDEMDILDNRFGNLGSHGAAELGRCAARVVPELVYYILLSNPNMADGDAMFDATIGNLITGSAFTAANLKTAITAFNTFTENGVVLNNDGPTILLTSQKDSFDAEQTVRSATISNDSGKGENNPLSNRQLVPLFDGRLDVGVTDPDSRVTAAGQPDNWYLLKGGLDASIEVGHVRETGRMPTVESEPMTGGSWGYIWSIKKDAGAKAIKRLRGLKATA